MAVIQIPGPISGQLYSLLISGDTPSPTEQERIRSYLNEQEALFSQQYEANFGVPLTPPDDGTAIGRGWDIGKSSAYSRLGSAAEYLGSGLGLESLQGYGAGMRAEGDYNAFLKSLRQPAPTTLQDIGAAEGIFPTLGKALTYAGEQIGQTAPESLASLGATVGGTLIGGPVAGVAAGALTAAPTIFGGNIQRQEAEVAAGRKPSVDVGAALLATVGQSALESISNKLLLTGLVKPGMNIFIRAVTGAVEGTTTEGVTEIGQQVLERYQAGLPLDDNQAIQEYIDAGVAGGLIGGAVRGTTAGLGIGGAEAVTPEDISAVTPEDVRSKQPMGVSLNQDVADARDYFEERAGIIEADGASRADAEQQAASLTLKYLGPKADQPNMQRFANQLQRMARGRTSEKPLSEADAFELAVADASAKAPLGEVTPRTLADIEAETTAEQAATMPLFNAPRPEVGTAPTAPTPAAPTPTAPAPTLTHDMLDAIGVGKNAAVPARKLVGTAMDDPKVQSTLKSLAQNPNIPPEGRQRAAEMATTPTAPTTPTSTQVAPPQPVAPPPVAPKPQTPAPVQSAQPDLFAPPKPATPPIAEVQNAAPTTETGQEPAGAGDASRVESVAERGVGEGDVGTTGRAEAAQPQGLGSSVPAPVGPAARAEVPPAQLIGIDDIEFEVPKPKRGFTRIYRFGVKDKKIGKVADWVAETEDYKNMLKATGRWFSDNIDEAKWYQRENPEGELLYVDIPTVDVEGYRVSNLIETSDGLRPKDFSARHQEELFVPREIADTADSFSKLQAIGYENKINQLALADFKAAEVPPAQLTTPSAPEPELRQRTLKEKLQALQAEADTIRAKANTIRQTLPPPVKNQFDQKLDATIPPLRKALTKAETRLREAEAAAAKAKQGVPEKKTNPIYQKRFDAYTAAVDQTTQLRDEVLAAREAVHAAEYNALTSRTPPERLPGMTPKQQKAYTDYINTLREAQVLRDQMTPIQQELDSMALQQAPTPPARPNLSEPVVAQPWLTAERGMGPAVPPTPYAPTAVARQMADEQAMAVLAERYVRVTPVAVQQGARDLNNPGSWERVPERSTTADKQLVARLLATKDKGMSPEERAAKLYFGKVIRPTDAMSMVVDDLTADYGRFRSAFGEKASTTAFMRGTGNRAATAALKFMRSRMSPEFNRAIDAAIAQSAIYDKRQATWLDAADKVEQDRAKRKEARAAQQAAAMESGYGDKANTMYRADPRAEMGRQLHYSVRMALQAGKLSEALQALSDTATNSELRTLAAKFSTLTGTTRVQIVDPGHPNLPRGCKGIYWQSRVNPDRQNIIYLNSQTGLDVHTLMHEMAHVVTAEIINQPNHPVTRQLQNLFEQFKRNYSFARADQLGITDVSEFVAEAMGRVAYDEDTNGFRALMRNVKVMSERKVGVQVELNAWDRFREIMANFFRSLVGKEPIQLPRETRMVTESYVENLLDKTLRLTDGILSQAPQVLPSAVINQSVGNPLRTRNVIDMAVRNAPDFDKEGALRFANNIAADWIPPGARSLLLGVLQLDWFADLAEKYFPQVRQLKEIDNLRRGYIEKQRKAVTGVAEQLIAYAKMSPDAFTKLMALQGRATLAGVDFTKPVTTYADDKAKTDLWHELNREAVSFDTTGMARELFKKTRNLYAGLYKELQDTLELQVSHITPDKELRKSLYKRLMQQIVEDGVIDPYFSLIRKGDFWMTFQATDPTSQELTSYTMAFDTARERDHMLQRLRAAKNPDGSAVLRGEPELRGRPVQNAQDQGVTPEVVQSVIQIINATVPVGEHNKEAVESIKQLFLKLTPEHSMLRAFNKRKGVRGFMGDITPLGVVDTPHDMAVAIIEKSYDMVYQLANMRYGADVSKLRQEVREQYARLQGAGTMSSNQAVQVQAYAKEFDDRAAFIQSPRVSKGSQVVRGVTFGWTMGANIASAANVFMQLPMVAVPHLAGKYSARGTIRELRAASRLLLNAGKDNKILTYGEDAPEVRTLSGMDHWGSIANYFDVDGTGAYSTVRADKKVPPGLRKKLEELAPLVEMLSANGLLTHSMSQELLATENDWLAKINKWSGFMMHHAERYTRQVTAIAAYNLALDKVRKPDGSVTAADMVNAARSAITDTELVNGAVGMATAPRLAQNPVGFVVFLFKMFGLSMARYIALTTRNATRFIEQSLPEDQKAMAKQERAIARYQLAGLLGSTFLFAGAQGLPFYGEIMAMLNGIWTDDDEEDFQTALQKYLQEPFYNGALNYLTGAEIASRISMSNLIFRENMIEKDQSVLYDLVDTFGGPTLGLFMNFERAYGLINDGEIYRGIEAAMPSAIKSGMKALRFGTEGATTLRGDQVVPLNPGDILVQALGYTPATYATKQEIISREKRIDAGVSDRKRKLYRRYALAKKDGDAEEMRAIWQEMLEFNRQHPEAAITRKSLDQSLSQFERTSNEMIGGVSFTPTRQDIVARSVAEYDPDVTLWADEGAMTE